MVQQEAPRVREQSNVELVGYHDLNGRPGFKMGMQTVGNRWYLYLAHIWPWQSGWSILDVTDPKEPVLENFIEGPKNTWTIQMQVAEGKMVTALEQPGEGWGGDMNAPYEEGAIIWDVSQDPLRPVPLGRYRTGGAGTHRNYYAGGRYVYMAAYPTPGYVGKFCTVVDIADPTKPVEISRWYLPEQKLEPGEEMKPSEVGYMHGPAYVIGDRAYLSYGKKGGIIILDVSDPHRLELISRVSMGDLGSRAGCHSVVPIPDRKLLVANSEAIAEGPGQKEPANYAITVDVSDEVKPVILSSFPIPRPSKGMPYTSYYQRPGRFGPHNQHHHQNQKCLLYDNKTIYMTWFNAGVRVFDISDPSMPEEIGHLVLDDPKVRIGVKPENGLTTQSEDVLVDARGFAYVTDKNHGLTVLKFSGR